MGFIHGLWYVLCVYMCWPVAMYLYYLQVNELRLGHLVSGERKTKALGVGNLNPLIIQLIYVFGGGSTKISPFPF